MGIWRDDSSDSWLVGNPTAFQVVNSQGHGFLKLTTIHAQCSAPRAWLELAGGGVAIGLLLMVAPRIAGRLSSRAKWGEVLDSGAREAALSALGVVLCAVAPLLAALSRGLVV